jgi:hypothetical protein
VRRGAESFHHGRRRRRDRGRAGRRSPSGAVVHPGWAARSCPGAPAGVRRWCDRRPRRRGPVATVLHRAAHAGERCGDPGGRRDGERRRCIVGSTCRCAWGSARPSARSRSRGERGARRPRGRSDRGHRARRPRTGGNRLRSGRAIGERCWGPGPAPTAPILPAAPPPSGGASVPPMLPPTAIDEVTCSNCGEASPAGSRFCSNCGSRLGSKLGEPPG